MMHSNYLNKYLVVIEKFKQNRRKNDKKIQMVHQLAPKQAYYQKIEFIITLK